VQIFKHNWQVKLVAFVLAVVCKYYIQREQNHARDEYRLPVSILAPTGQRVISPPTNYRIYVSVQGPAEVIRSIRSDEIRLKYDTSLARPGRRFDVPVEVELPEKYRDRVILSWTPRSMPVEFASDATKKLPVVVIPTNRIEGWEMTDPPQADPGTVTVSGTEETLRQVARVVAPITLKSEARIDEWAAVQAQGNDGRVLDPAIEPAQVHVTGFQQHVLLTKRVPVQPVFSLPPGVTATVEVAPPRVRLTGPEKAIGEVYFLETDKIDVPRGQKEPIRRLVAVRAPQPGIPVEPPQVQVMIRLTPVRRP